MRFFSYEWHPWGFRKVDRKGLDVLKEDVEKMPKIPTRGKLAELHQKILDTRFKRKNNERY